MRKKGLTQDSNSDCKAIDPYNWTCELLTP